MGKLGPGIPDDFPTPYPYGFGLNQQNPLEIDLTETHQFAQLCGRLGIKILNLTAGSNPVTTTDVTSQLEPDSVVLRPVDSVDGMTAQSVRMPEALLRARSAEMAMSPPPPSSILRGNERTSVG